MSDADWRNSSGEDAWDHLLGENYDIDRGEDLYRTESIRQ